METPLVSNQPTSMVEETETWVREELGDARSFSLDTPKSGANRIAALRQR